MWASASCGWELDLRKVDILKNDITTAKIWSPPVRGTIEEGVVAQVVNSDHKRQLSEETIKRWANRMNSHRS